MDTLARAPGGQMRGAATKSMSDIVEERQQRRYAPFAAAPLRAAARRPAGFVARSSHTAPGIARRSRLASGPGGQQQSVHIISSQTLSTRAHKYGNQNPATDCNKLRKSLATNCTNDTKLFRVIRAIRGKPF